MDGLCLTWEAEKIKRADPKNKGVPVNKMACPLNSTLGASTARKLKMEFGSG